MTIYEADSTDLSFLAPDSVQLIVTSPPYNLGKDYGTARDDATYHQYLDWVVSWSRELWRVLEPGGRLCLNIPLDINLSFDAGGKRVTQKRPVLADFTHRLVNEEAGWLYNTTILWLEGNISRRTAWGSWLKASDPWVNTAAEAVLVLSKEKRKRDGRGKHTEISREEFMDWTLGLWRVPRRDLEALGPPRPVPGGATPPVDPDVQLHRRRCPRPVPGQRDHVSGSERPRAEIDRGRRRARATVRSLPSGARSEAEGPATPHIPTLRRHLDEMADNEYVLARLRWARSVTRRRGRSGT